MKQVSLSKDSIDALAGSLVIAMRTSPPQQRPTVNINNINNNNNITCTTTNKSIHQNAAYFCDDSHVRDLGDEDLSDFPPERLLELIEQQDFTRFVRETRFDPEKPHNRNLRIVDPHHNRARLKKRGAWHEGTIAKALDEALAKSVNQFFQPLDETAAMEGGLLDHEMYPHRYEWHCKVASRRRDVWQKIKNDARGDLMRCFEAERARSGRRSQLLTTQPDDPA